MHLNELQQFFDYEPIFSEDPQFLVDEIKDLAVQYLPVENLPLIQKTYEFTKSAHDTTKRLSGEPYIVHPLRATLFLMSMKPDLPTIQTCILHDVIEDTDITYDDVKKEFGAEVANLCEWLVKVAKVRYSGEDRQLETLKKTFLAMGKDLRVIFVKLVDRIHNIQTLHFHPTPEKRARIAEETLKIYVPIAKRLGLFYYQQFLENGAFRILYPKEFDRIFTYLEKMLGVHDTITQKGVKMLQDLLTEEHLPATQVIGRVKSPYRIFEKLQRKYNSTDISKVTDLIAFRIITDNIGNCYNTLGVIHAHYIPLIKKIKDYIAIPKSNEYKSIHTTILGMFDFPVEIQIRTEEMDDVAEYGVAAHFGYAENRGSTTISERQSQWIKRLQEIVAAYTNELDKEKFKTDLNIELFDRNIFVYTQKGDVIELPEGSSVLDFAFRIHSDLGLRFNNATVNGSIVPISQRLNTGDIVVINAFKNKFTGSSNRFEYLHTPSAKAKLTKFLKTKERTHLLDRSLKLLDEKLKELGLPALYSKDDRITKQYKNSEFDRALLQLLDKQFWYTTFARKIYKDILPEDFLHQQQAEKKKTAWIVQTPLAQTVVVDGDMTIGYFLCPECRPEVGNKIIARSGKDGIKIHRMSCVALQSVSYNKLLEAHRAGQEQSNYKFSLKLLCDDQPGILLQLFEVFSELRLNITWIHSEMHNINQQYVYLTVDVNNPAKIQFLINELKKHVSSLKIVKKTLE